MVYHGFYFMLMYLIRVVWCLISYYYHFVEHCGAFFGLKWRIWLSFSLAKCGRLGVMFLNRLVMYEASYAKTATS